MSGYLSDRQRVELAVPALLVRRVTLDIRRHPDTGTADCARLDGIVDDIDTAIAEAAGPDVERAAKVRRRAQRAAQAAIPTRTEHLASMVLGIRLLTQMLIDEGWLQIHDGGAFDRAWTDLAEGLESAEDAGALDRPERRAEADRIYRQMRAALAGQGLYQAEGVAA